MRKIFCKEKTPRDGSAQMEFNNQNGGSFMNKLFKATLLSGIVVASVLLTSCGSDGSNGPAGAQGQPGADCSLDVTGGQMTIMCGGIEVYALEDGEAGANGPTGPSGTGCTLQRSATGFDVMCGGALFGQIRNGNDAEPIDPGEIGGVGCVLEDFQDSLVVTCGGSAGNKFVMSLCNGSTFDSKKVFCAALPTTSVLTDPNEKKLQPLCNKSDYDVETQYCARNLYVEVDYAYAFDKTLTKTYKDLDTLNTNSNNWKVLAIDSCFVSGEGVQWEGPCGMSSSSGAIQGVVVIDHMSSSTTSWWDALALPTKWGGFWGSSSSGTVNLPNVITDSKIVRTFCPNGTLLDLSTVPPACILPGGGQSTSSTVPGDNGWTVGVGTADGCKTVLGNSNVCYSGNETSSNVFAKSCVLETANTLNATSFTTEKIFYDPSTITRCDTNRVEVPFAFTCATDKHWSGSYYTGSATTDFLAAATGNYSGAKYFHGRNFAYRVACVADFDPEVCPVGSTYSSTYGNCVLSSGSETPRCPEGYRRGTTADTAGVTGFGSPINPINYCFTEVAKSMCPTGTAPGAETALGQCVIEDAYKVVPQPSAQYSARDTVAGRFTLTPVAGTTGVCRGLENSGYGYNAATGLCEILNRTPFCQSGYKRELIKVGTDSNYYCIYTPQAKDCSANYSFVDDQKRCLPPLDDGEPIDIKKLVDPNCPYGKNFNQDLKLCYEKIGDSNCHVNSTISSADSLCTAQTANPSCPEGGVWDVTNKYCYVNFSTALCQTNGSIFSYNGTSKACQLQTSPLWPTCPAITVASGFVSTVLTNTQASAQNSVRMCGVQISSRYCPLNLDNLTWWDKTNDAATNIISQYVTTGSDSTLLNKCSFRTTDYLLGSTNVKGNTAYCDEYQTVASSKTGRCEN
jgi:hypothetical protein